MEQTKLQKFMASLPQAAVDYLAGIQSRGTDLVFKEEPYFSRVRFEPTIAIDGSNNGTYTFPQGLKAQAFGYGQGASMAAAGFVAGGTGYSVATPADTNLTTANGKLTNGSDLVVIKYISFLPLGDAKLLRKLLPELYITAGFAGVEDQKFGSPLFYPAGAGLHGQGSSVLEQPPLGDQRATVGNVTNGIPSGSAMHEFTDPIVWFPQPEPDSQFTLSLNLARQVVVTAAARAAATGVAAYTPPATAGAEGTYVDFEVRLHGAQVGPRGRTR